jgi:hypothetical protein
MVALVYRVSVEIDSAVKNDVVNKASKNKKKSKKTKSKSVAMANSEGDLNSSNEYVTGFDAYVEELNGGRDDK